MTTNISRTAATRFANSIAARAFGSLTTVVVALLITAPANVTAQQKEQPPAPAPAKDFKLPAKKSFTLDNGMKVTLVPFGEIPKVDVQLAVRVGNVDEGPNEVWLADVMGDLMREGTTSKTGTELSVLAANMGGSFSTGVSPDELTVFGTALSEYAADITKLVAEIALSPAFPESELARIKQNRLRSLALAKSQPATLATEKFYNLLYPDHPYGRFFPSEAMLQGYTIRQIRDFYDRNVHASRAHLFIAGRFDAATVEKAVREAFAGWQSGKAVMPEPAKPFAKRGVYIIDRPGAVQSSMYIGGPTIDNSHADYIPLVVTNALLGGSFASRITKNIREDKGYTYSPYSMISTRYRSAFWAEVADVTTAVTGASISEILKEIDRLQNEPPSAAELKGIQDYIAGTFTLQNSSRSGFAAMLRTMNLHGLPDSYLTDYVKKVYAVTPADVQRVARTYLADDDYLIVIVGDKKAIESQVAQFGPIY